MAEGCTAVQTKIKMSSAKKLAYLDVTFTDEFDKFGFIRWWQGFKRSIEAEYWWEIFKPLLKLVIKFGQCFGES